jgi:rRNA-processing protein FCF1
MAFDWVRGDKIRKTVILDSSAILMFFEFSINWEKELDRLVGAYRLLVPTAVVNELQILAKHDMGQKKAAAALKLIARYQTIGENADSADESLLKIAEKTQGIVVTNDRELRERLKERRIPVIFVRGKKKLVLDE